MSTPHDRIEAKLGLGGPLLRRVRDESPKIPDHHLFRRIGHGAYGEVWLAQNALGMWRAVKIVYRDVFNDARPYEREFAGIRRFEPLSRSNEGLVDILHVGRDDTAEWFYYVMELADHDAVNTVLEPAAPTGAVPVPDLCGSVQHPSSYTPRTLARELQHRGRLALTECLELGLAMSLALGYLHRHGLIHRDVKPSNIIFVGGVPKLADIGLVTEAGGANTFVGTEGFVPPEGPTSPQADIYALGKVLYEAAMGKDRNEFPEPFSAIGTDRDSLALMELNAILLRACAPDPGNRYGSAEEMHADLALLHSGGSVKRRHQFEKRFRAVQRVGGVAALAALLFGGAWFWQHSQTEKMAGLAREKIALANQKAQLAANLASLGEENREQLARLKIANGVRLLDEEDPAGALLWFTQALPLLTNNPAQESIHRIRIQQALNQTPRLVRMFPHPSGVVSSTFSHDGEWIANGSVAGSVRVWSATSGSLRWETKDLPWKLIYLRFSRDGHRLFVSSTTDQYMFNGLRSPWNYYAVLDAQSGQMIWPAAEAIPGIATNVICSAFSPDDRWLAAGQGSSIQLFDLEKQCLAAEWTGHSNDVLYVSFSGDGRLLASASMDRSVRMWRVPSGEPVGEPFEHRFPVVRVCLDYDGEYMVSASFKDTCDCRETGEGEVQAWHVPDHRLLGPPLPGTNWLGIFIEPGLKGRAFVASGSAFNAYSFEPFAPTLAVSLSQPNSWSFSRDGLRVALGDAHKPFVRVLDAHDGTLTWGPLRQQCSSVQFSPDENSLLVAADGVASVWDLSPPARENACRKLPFPMQPKKPEEFYVPFFGPMPIALQKVGLRFFGSDLEEAHVFQLFPPGQQGMWRGLKRGWNPNIWAVQVKPPGDKTSPALLIWRTGQHESALVRLPDSDMVEDYIFTRDDKFVISRCSDRVVRFWRTADAQLERSIPEPAPEAGRIVDLSFDGKTAFWLAWAPRQMRFVDLDTGAFTGEPAVLPISFWNPVFAPNGEQVALIDPHGPVIIVEARTGRLISQTILHPDNVFSVQWSPDSRWLLTAGYGDEVLVWDAVAGEQVSPPLRIPGVDDRTGCVGRWSPDGRFVVTHRKDRVRVWEAATGHPVTPLLQHSGEVGFALITPGNRLISAMFPDLLRAWDLTGTDLASELLADYAKLVSGRRLDRVGVPVPITPEERAQLSHSLRLRAPQLFE